MYDRHRCSHTVSHVAAVVSITVAEFKEKVATAANIPADQQRIIFSGHVLKDNATLDSYCTFIPECLPFTYTLWQR